MRVRQLLLYSKIKTTVKARPQGINACNTLSCACTQGLLHLITAKSFFFIENNAVELIKHESISGTFVSANSVALQADKQKLKHFLLATFALKAQYWDALNNLNS